MYLEQFRRELLAPGGLFPLREANWSPPDTDVRPVDLGGDAVLVQLLVGPGCDSRSNGPIGDQHAHPGDDVHRSQERHSSCRVRESTFS